MEALPLDSGPFGHLAIQSPLTECAPRIENPLTITSGNESGNLINLTSFQGEYQLILCAQTSREEVGRWSVDRAVECGFGAEDPPSWKRPEQSCKWLLDAEELVRHLLCG